MANLNRVLLIGRLTRDPEVRHTPNGSVVADFGLAVNRTWKGNDGQQQEETTFVDVTAWGRTAELAGQYLAKGRQVFVEGRLKLDQWDDKTSGQKRSKLTVVVENLQFLDAKGEGGGPQGGGGGGDYSRAGGGGRSGGQGGQGGYGGGPRSGPSQGGDDYGYNEPSRDVGGAPNDDIPF